MYFEFRPDLTYLLTPMSQQCIDPIVGKILAGWRYDISGLAPEMRGDYESHLAECEHCSKRQQIHRIIDVGLIALASISAGVFLLAFGVILYLGPHHAFLLEIAALAGFALSALIWLGVAVATPAPVSYRCCLDGHHWTLPGSVVSVRPLFAHPSEAGDNSRFPLISSFRFETATSVVPASSPPSCVPLRI